MHRSYYSNALQKFISDDSALVLGRLAQFHTHALEDLQKNAWMAQIEIIKENLSFFDKGSISFEYAIPRMGKRVDNIFINRDIVFVIEFKVGATKYEKHAIDQVMDYALDLKNFHEKSHNAKLVPVLVATEAMDRENDFMPFEDKLYNPLYTNRKNLCDILFDCISTIHGETDIDANEWYDSIYKPTPTIIEAAQALYNGHDVKEISRSDSGAINLSRTSDCIDEIIDFSKQNNRKSICFITGVPGAGKTLAGLNIANQRRDLDEDEHSVFLSGNGPLVDVLREALIRDEVAAKGITKKAAQPKAYSFIQNIHHFRDDALATEEPPVEKVVVFDEAQRAWNADKATSFMKVKKGVLDFNMSEPEFLISIMDRHKDWCTIICLIGGGQEINTGEAGLEEWFNALRNRFSEWDVYYSNLIVNDSNYLNSQELKKEIVETAIGKDDLHLAVSVRSFRSERLSEFVQLLLDCNLESAKEVLKGSLEGKYPIRLTRDINTAKKWLKNNARGTERYGVLASSGGIRLRPFGINVKNSIEAPNWFLNHKYDIRSSFFMEEVATEFDIQGLELDWIGVCWDGDLYYNDGWTYRKFRGTKWQNINKEVDKHFLINAYRVLLTRARQGMVIFVPDGNDEDETRLKEFYDGTYNFLKEIGIKEI